jgi:hypothetical protein
VEENVRHLAAIQCNQQPRCARPPLMSVLHPTTASNAPI